jgi:16S rRNA (guanine966-N2)-methyltransferase
MRIITGQYRGRTIRTVGGLSVRPATDRVRQAVFNILSIRMRLEGARVLDLFAGSGSLGLEALSRGAVSAVFVEGERSAAKIIEETAQEFGCRSAAVVVCTDAIAYLEQESEAYDLIFADPPYACAETAGLPHIIFSRGLLRSGGYLLIEHARPLSFQSTELYTAGPVKRFGRTMVTFFQGAVP